MERVDEAGGPGSGADWLESALDRLSRDGFVAYPTETVWGLGACADREAAIRRIFAWKGRSDGSPLAVLVTSVGAAEAIGCALDVRARRLAERFWPGPLMLVVPCRGRFAPGVARADGALGLRCSPHPIAAGLADRLERAGFGPLTSTSLNPSGRPPAANRAEAIGLVGPAGDARDLDQPLLVAPPGYDAGGGAPSTVVDCTQPRPGVLRVGAIAREAIEAVVSA